jgi:tetratricopeptide (TPR) repeat protein
VHRFVPFPFACLLSLAFFSLAALIRSPQLYTGAILNQLAVQTVHSCTDAKPVTLGPVEDGSQFLYLAGRLAQCQGRDDRAKALWSQMLAQTAMRMDLVRATWPWDVILARLATEMYPEQATASFWLGDALREEGDAIGAIAAYEAGLQLEPTAALVWDRVGRLYEDVGDPEKAVHAYDRACYYVDRGKNGCLHAGRVYLELNKYEEAADRYRTSLQQLPDYATARRGLIEALLALGRTEEALPHLQALADRGDEQAQQTLRELTQ